ncbi:MAG: hypothetical protein QOF68_3217 [Gaiellales bacterium]|nr:hypothetical protein [Gaiellales bacterium]
MLPFITVFMLLLLVTCGIVIDIGHAYRVKRALQASVDAAAAAGAGQLPDPALAVSTAHIYSAEDGGLNTITSVSGVKVDALADCATGPKFCNPANTVHVTATADVPTTFLRLVGIDTIPETVSASACSPCGAVPLDIVIALDRSGSMNAAKIQAARDGINAFLASMDPSVDQIGLAVFPPASAGGACQAGAQANYDVVSNPYMVVPLSTDYGTMVGNTMVPNPSSALVSTVACVAPGGSTAYANAIDASQSELLASGRPGVQKVIVVLSDGAANTGPGYLPASSSYRTQPCNQAISSAATAKAAGTLVYSIAYDLSGAGSEACRNDSGSAEAPAITATGALQAIASPGNYYAQPLPSQLTSIFLAISADLGRGSTRLNG